MGDTQFGIFSELTFSNGGTPPIDEDALNELERVVNLADKELARSTTVKMGQLIEYFFQRNTHAWLFFENYSSWTNNDPTNYTLSDESSSNLIGNACMKMTVITASAGWMGAYRSLSPTVDLTLFEDGSASSTSDCIILMFYVSDYAAFSKIQFRFGTDHTNCYFIDVAGGYSSGWNALYPQKSDFTTIGSPAGWDSIAYVNLAPYVLAGNNGEYIYMQHFSLYRQDPVYSGYSNVFQEYMGSVSGWENVFSVFNDPCGIYYDDNSNIMKLGISHLETTVDKDILRISRYKTCFISKWEIYCKVAGYSMCITWLVDGSNYFTTYIDSNTFYLDGSEGGTPYSDDVALDNNLLKNERFYIYFEKDYQTIRAILLKDGENIKVLEYETSISNSDDGNIYIGQPSMSGYSLLTDFEVGHKRIDKLRNENLGLCIRKGSDEEFNNNTIANVAGMLMYLPPHGTYMIDAYIIAQNDDTTGDVKTAWDLTDCESETYRSVSGPANNTTDVGVTEAKLSNYGMTSEVRYGCDGTSEESCIHENFIVFTSGIAGKIQLKAAQYTTDAGNPTTISGLSYMIATPINMLVSH